MGTFEQDLADAVDGRILRGSDEIARYVVDWTGRWRGSARAVVRPRSVGEVAAAVDVCRTHGLPIVPQGGNTGMVGGSVPDERCVVVSTESLTDIGDVAPDGTITVGAGVTLAALRDVAQATGWATGLHIASLDSATIGGIASTNAGGARVMRYGSARARITGLRAVLANGTIVDRRYALPKDNTGYDLVDLFVGAEGTLGIVTDVTWRLVEPTTHTLVAVVRFDDTDTAVAALPTLRHLPGVEALEWVRGEDITRVAAFLDSSPPMRADGIWIFAAMGARDPHLLDAAIPVVEELVDSHGLSDGDVVVAEAPNEQRSLWAFREQMTEAISADGVPVKLDVAVPVDSFAKSCERVDAAVRTVDSRARTVLFGHFAEANFHISVLPPAGTVRYDDATADRIEDAVLAEIVAADGTISAEHGVGRAKQRWLQRQRGQVQYDVMAQIKAALDPEQLLNPGVLFPERR